MVRPGESCNEGLPGHLEQVRSPLHLNRTPASMIDTIGQIALTVSDVDRSIAFYRDTLGLRFLFSAGPTLAFLDAGGIRIMLSAAEGDFTPRASTVIYFRVADLDAEHAAMTSRGATFVDAPHLVAKMPDHELWMCFVKDPEGNAIGLMEERRS